MSNEHDRHYPAIPLRNVTVFPGMVMHFDVSRKKSVRAVEAAMSADELIYLVTQMDSQVSEPGMEDLYKVGTIAKIKQIIRMPGKILRVQVEGLRKAAVNSFEEASGMMIADVSVMPGFEKPDKMVSRAIIVGMRELLTQYAHVNPKFAKDTVKRWLSYNDAEKLMMEFAQEFMMDFDKRQQFLEAEEYEADVEKLDSPQYVKDKLKREIKRLKSLAGNNAEANVERTYIETCLELPWNVSTEDNKDIDNAAKVLDSDHYGMKDIKERILESLAVRNITGSGKAPVICLAGPPGTGKTSIARSVAKALGKEYVRICLGGVRDEAEIRGHRKTYIGAMPGRIIEGLKNAGVNNPLMLLDEIDKISSDYKGDTSAALLEVLDSEQNVNFVDHYIEMPVDLSNVLFIATANDLSNISRPLLDRMEIIEVGSYTANEKFHIAKEHLIKKQIKENGLLVSDVKFTDKVIRTVINSYTREAGVRGLERQIAKIVRKAVRELYKAGVFTSDGTRDKTVKKTVNISDKNITDYLGKVKYRPDKKNAKGEVGIVRGLAWTQAGGDTLEIEVITMPGKGEFKLTGNMGDVMKESASIAVSYIRSVTEKGRYKVDAEYFQKHAFHLHIPEGATPKDGPSAGITMATAVLSAVTGIPVRADVAMTGELTLRGKVLPIGGLKEKLLASKTAGITNVFVPRDNRSDVEELDTEITEGMNIIYVNNAIEVFAQALMR